MFAIYYVYRILKQD